MSKYACEILRAPEAYRETTIIPADAIMSLFSTGPSDRYICQLPPLKRGTQLLLFVDKLDESLRACDIHLIDANVWLDAGKEKPTQYHNDLWYSAAFEQPVLQLWIPLLCSGPADQIAASMLRIDRLRPCRPGWGCPPGMGEYRQLWTGERAPLAFENRSGWLHRDIDGIVGGDAVHAGDILAFDNRYCHYTLPSQAQRVALALRFVVGVPVYNGYFSAQRPLDFATVSEGNRRALARVFENYRPGDRVDPTKILERFAAASAESPVAQLLCDGRESSLNESNQRYAKFIVEDVARLCTKAN